MPSKYLASIRLSRRALGLAVFEQMNLEYTVLRHLSSAPEQAERSVAGLTRWVLERFDLEMLVVEDTGGAKNRRATLNEVVRQCCRDSGVPVWPVKLKQVLQSYGLPAHRTRDQLDSVVCRIWPMLDHQEGGSLVQQAAANGLYVQAERLLSA